MAAIHSKPPNKNGYWQNELRTLSIDPKRLNELNDTQELSGLTDNIKQVYFQDYKTAYDEEQDRSYFEYMGKLFDYII
jgi:hypothetical protein